MDETSQYPPPNAENDDNGDFLEEDDKTQPMEEHLQALRAMDIMNSSQDTDIVDPGPSSQVEAPPSTPPSPYSTVRQRVQTKPTDVDSWLALIRLADDSGDYDRVVETYEALLEVFPNTSTAQIAYIEHVLASQNPSKHATVAGLFNRFLKTSPFVELWKFYLAHVRKMHPDPSTRDTVRKAYEYALNHIGHDKESNEIWTDYIQFLKTGEAVTTWDEGQKMDAIRKAYQRAVQTPMENVKRLWEEYSEFETNLNKQLAKKFLSDLQTSHMQARTVLNTLQEHTNTLLSITGDRHGIWLPHPPTFSAEDKALVARWKQYLKWEESNPLEIEEKDRSQFHSRVQTVYRKALVKMRFFSEIWYMAYAWTLGVSSEAGLPENKRKERRDEALSILKAGIEANPKSFVLNFAYAEVLEDAKNLKEVHATFTKFIDILRSDLEELEATVKAEDEPSQDSNNAGGGVRSNNSSFTTQSSDESGNPSKELKNRRTEYGIAWIVYMRFARRAEMPRSARDVFSKARKDKWTPWEVYEAAALMEYHCTKATDVAMRIFERGLEKFPDEEEFALRYLGFLISINDDSS
ncbi:hypothetical protein EUX98_g4628 [Antrodiella citrinella]|uniref:mRNA 3'-end-processing protein RNA14 n=1 Tax=Antrodiella citrinella TaxID=2447956 RepID=A0A4S4MTH3_9APHY|nr:hypothetical protein EUX98_g4628 [Antrodiella citrinella]